MNWTTITSSLTDFSIAHGHVAEDFFSLIHGTVFTTAPIAAKLAVDTSLWGYEQIRRRKYYFLDRKKLLKRILRTTNIALFQKQREQHFKLGAYAEGVLCNIGTRAAWVGCIGKGSMYELRTNGERRLLGYINEDIHNNLDALGRDRYTWPSQESNIPFCEGDILILAAGDAATLSIGIFDEIARHGEDCKEIVNKEIPHTSWGVTIVKK